MRPGKAVRDALRLYRRSLPWFALLVPALGAIEMVRWEWNARRTFRLHEAEVREEIARLRQRDVRRPPLHGAPTPGNAWDSYAAAFKAVERIKRTGFPWTQIPTTQETAALQSWYGSILPLFEDGLSRVEMDVGFDYEKSSLDDQARWAYTVLKDLGRLSSGLHAAGEDRKALEVSITLLGVLSDLRRGTDSRVARLMTNCEDSTLRVCKQILSSHSLEPAELEALSGVVDRLISSRPDFHDLIAADFVVERQALLRSEAEDGSFFGWRSDVSWRQAFRPRMARAAQLRALRLAATEHALLRGKSGPEWVRGAFRIASQVRYRRVSDSLFSSALSCRSELEVRAQLQLFRAALAVARYGRVTCGSPASVEDLVPGFLDSVPLSPRTGETLLVSGTWISFEEDPKSGWTVGRRNESGPVGVR